MLRNHFDMPEYTRQFARLHLQISNAIQTVTWALEQCMLNNGCQMSGEAYDTLNAIARTEAIGTREACIEAVLRR